MDAIAIEQRIEDLSKEIDAIHYADRAYWRSENHTHMAIAEYHRRQERLQEIRDKLVYLVTASRDCRHSIGDDPRGRERE